MDKIVLCDVCRLEFNDFHVTPKVLFCGHSFCSPCIKKLVDNGQTCPNCRLPIIGEEDSYPINYSILRSTEVYNSMRRSEKGLASSLKVMKEKCRQRKEAFTKLEDEIKLSFEIIENCLTKVQQMLDSETRTVDNGKAEDILRVAEEYFKKTYKVIVNISWKLENSVSIRFSSFEKSENYLMEIYKRVESEEKVFSAHQIEDEIKYGKISVRDNKIIFHSLSLSKVPEESVLILFDDLKECEGFKNFHTFIKISCDDKMVGQMICFEMFDKHLSTHFIKLCTGECGSSYKGSSFKMGPHTYSNTEIVLSVDDNFNNMRKSMGYKFFKYDKFISNFLCDSNEVFLTLKDNGSFKITHMIKSFQCSFLQHGRVVYPDHLQSYLDFRDPSDVKILDCGILFHI